MTGKRFVCRSAIVALETVDGKRVALTVPKGSTLQVISGPIGTDGMVSVLWENRPLTVFPVDLGDAKETKF